MGQYFPFVLRIFVCILTDTSGLMRMTHGNPHFRDLVLLSLGNNHWGIPLENPYGEVGSFTFGDLLLVLFTSDDLLL